MYLEVYALIVPHCENPGMTELTIDQALQQAVEAHKTGYLQKAVRLYTAILKAQPKHPDTNHNMGVLAVGVGKVQEALPFFKTALEAKPATAQFYHSYIDALIKLERIADAKVVLDQANSMGANDAGLYELEQGLNEASTENPVDNIRTETLEINQSSPLRIAIQLRDSGKFNQAIDLLKDETNQFPEGADKLALLSHCYLLADQVDLAKLYLDKATTIAPDNALVGWNTARLALKEQKLSEALNIARNTSQRFPDDVEGMGVLGACLRANGEADESLKVLNRAIALNPDYAEALVNRGLIRLSQENKTAALSDLDLAHRSKPHIKQIWDLVVGLKVEAQEYSDAILLLINIIEIDPENENRLVTLALCYQKVGDLDAALETYQKALAIKPDCINALINMGITLKDQGKLKEALQAYNKVLTIEPNSFEAYSNMGNVLKDYGKLEEAFDAYCKAQAIKPNSLENLENSQSLAIQLLPIITNYGYDFDNISTDAVHEAVHRPKYQVQQLIKTFLEANFSAAYSNNNNFKVCDQKFLSKLSSKDRVFCNAYSNLIENLLNTNWDEEPTSKNKIYHLGESHCLSFAHRNITISGTNFKITPRITFGAKAFHFSSAKSDSFKAITKAHLVSLPQNSKVFLSYGEIDCRPNEGFIPAAKKLAKPLKNLITETVEGYIQWFLEQNKCLNHRLYFLNVPAPVYDEHLHVDLNSEVAKNVILFNTALEKNLLKHGFDMVDVYKFTAGKEGFSNGFFHIDGNHLSPSILNTLNVMELQ